MNGSGTCTTNNACRGDSCSNHTMNATLNLNIVIAIVMKFEFPLPYLPCWSIYLSYHLPYQSKGRFIYLEPNFVFGTFDGS